MRTLLFLFGLTIITFTDCYASSEDFEFPVLGGGCKNRADVQTIQRPAICQINVCTNFNPKFYVDFRAKPTEAWKRISRQVAFSPEDSPGLVLHNNRETLRSFYDCAKQTKKNISFRVKKSGQYRLVTVLPQAQVSPLTGHRFDYTYPWLALNSCPPEASKSFPGGGEYTDYNLCTTWKTINVKR